MLSRAKETKKKETSYFAIVLLIISNNRRESPLYISITVPRWGPTHQPEQRRERERERDQSMQVKVIIRIFKLFYSQAMIHNICYFNQKINELRLRGKTAKDYSKYVQKLFTLIKKRQETIERDGWKLSTNEVLAIATTINNMKDDTTESSAKNMQS